MGNIIHLDPSWRSPPRVDRSKLFFSRGWDSVNNLASGMQRVWSAQSDAAECSQTQLMRSDRKLTGSCDAVGRGRTWSDVVGRS